METTIKNPNRWEILFGRYIEALKQEDLAYKTKRKTGRVAHMRVGKALKALRQIDSDFVNYVL